MIEPCQTHSMQVPLEDWVKQIIRETVHTHRVECAIREIVEGKTDNKDKSLIVRVDRIERTLVLAAWLIGPVYVAGIGFMVTGIIKHFMN